MPRCDLRNLLRNPVGIQPHPAKVGHQPEPSDAWGRSAWHACGWVSREPGRPHRLHLKGCRGAGTGSPRPRPWTSHLASDGANCRCSDGTAGRRQRSAGGWTARSRSVSEYRRSGGIEPTRPRGGKGAPAGGTVGGKDGQHTEVGSRLHVTTTDSRTGQTSLRDGGGHRLASWTSGYATARSEAVCRGAGCGRTRTSGSVGDQGQQRPWSTRPVVGHVGPAELGHGLKDFRPGEARASALLLAADGGLRGSVACDNNLSP